MKPKWFEAAADGVRYYQLRPPYDRVFVGSDPRDGMAKTTADSFDAFVNVSDTPGSTFEGPSRPGQAMHWYPVNEGGRWNLSYLYWLVKVLDHHYDRGDRVYLHCHAGAYRSPSAAVLWLQSRGHTPAEALTLGKESGSYLYRLWDAYGNIPKRANELFKVIRAGEPGYSLGWALHKVGDFWDPEVISGYTRRSALLHKYAWFWYKPKYWLKDWTQRVGYWFKGHGYRRDGFCTIVYRRKHRWVWPKDAEPIEEDREYGKKLS